MARAVAAVVPFRQAPLDRSPRFPEASPKLTHFPRKDNHHPGAPAFAEAGRFAVNVLAAGQEHLSRRFATPLPDKFAGVETRLVPGGVPVLAGTLAHFACRAVATYDGGDHLIFVGKVEDFRREEGEPLVFHSGGCRAFSAPDREMALCEPAR